MFTQLLTDDDRLRAFMLSPQVDRRFKAQMLEKALAGKVSQLYYHFLLLLLRKGRQSLYQEIEYEMGASVRRRASSAAGDRDVGGGAFPAAARVSAQAAGGEVPGRGVDREHHR